MGKILQNLEGLFQYIKDNKIDQNLDNFKDYRKVVSDHDMHIFDFFWRAGFISFVFIPFMLILISGVFNSSTLPMFILSLITCVGIMIGGSCLSLKISNDKKYLPFYYKVFPHKHVEKLKLDNIINLIFEKISCKDIQYKIHNYIKNIVETKEEISNEKIESLQQQLNLSFQEYEENLKSGRKKEAIENLTSLVNICISLSEEKHTLLNDMGKKLALQLDSETAQKPIGIKRHINKYQENYLTLKNKNTHYPLFKKIQKKILQQQAQQEKKLKKNKEELESYL